MRKDKEYEYLSSVWKTGVEMYGVGKGPLISIILYLPPDLTNGMCS